MIRVLIAEDSSTVRGLLQNVLTADSEICVIGTANDGLEAVAHTKRLKPDLIVMDINMPKMDGLQATKHIMIEQPTPIIIVSATRDVRDTTLSVAALNAGALALLPNPSGVGPEFEQSARQLVSTVKAMAGFKLVRHWPPKPTARSPHADAIAPFGARVIAIGASTGGPSALAKILSGLPSNFPAPILVVQHIARGFAPGLASWLNTICPLKVKIAAAGEQVTASTVYLAGDGFHLAVSRQFRIRLDDSQPIDGFRPSATQRRSTERQLRQAQKMEAVGQLAGGIAHDFNNLLTVVLSNLELAKEMVALEPRVERMLDAALRAGDRGATLTRRLLAFSRQQSFDYKVWDIGTLISGMEEMLRRTLGGTVAIKTIVPGGDWLTLTNEAESESALLNLAINSRDAMPAGGQLTIEVSGEILDDDYVAHHPGLKPGGYISVCVSDTGVGIPHDQQERIFEPFFTTKEVGKGTGLGLSMVYGFVKQSGGYVNLYSEVGHGTSVRLYLPRVADVGAGKPENAEKTAESATQLSPKVLIVDDNDDVRQVGVTTLKLLNCRVVEARDPAEALRVLEQNSDIDILFTDLIMPGALNGIALAAEARKRQPDLKVVFCCGFAASAMTERHKLAEGEAFVAKPYRRADLAAKLTGVMARKSV